MKYICLVYQEKENLLSTSEPDLAACVRDVSDWVDALEAGGHHVYSAGLQAPTAAVTLRKRNGEMTVTDGPFAETKEFLGGFTILEARDLNEAIQQGSKLASVCRGTVEVRPLLEFNQELSDPLDRKLASAIKAVAEGPSVSP